MDGKPFRSFSHTADVGLIVRGKTRRQLFHNAAAGMLSLVTGPPSGPAVPSKKTIRLTAPDPESLFIRWLNEVLFLTVHRRFFPVRTRFHQLTSRSLSALLSGHRLPPEHPFLRDMKAATFHKLSIRRKNARWTSTIVFDV
ncbi:MAG TPA: archease [Elusimicrobiota bacterium]|nr:archease [Elusimicrobiota bacterium]